MSLLTILPHFDRKKEGATTAPLSVIIETSILHIFVFVFFTSLKENKVFIVPSLDTSDRS